MNPGVFGFPEYKSKHSKQSYTCKNNKDSVRVVENKVKIPKIGFVKFKKSKDIFGRILSATISRSKTHKYYVSINVERSNLARLPKTNKSVGLDLGIKTLIVASDSQFLPNNKYLIKSQDKLTKLQQQATLRAKGGKLFRKDRLKINRLHDKIHNQRFDTIHKYTTWLVRNYDVICIEDLDVKGMLERKEYSYDIQDCGWGEIKRQLEYKCQWYGKKLVKVEAAYTSKTCSNCGNIKNDLCLSDRTYTCNKCEYVGDRDVNAAKNILTVGTMGIAERA